MAVLKRTVSAQPGVQSVYHDLNTTDVMVQVRTMDGTFVLPTVFKVTQPNSVEIEFDEQFVGQTYEVLIAY